MKNNCFKDFFHIRHSFYKTWEIIKEVSIGVQSFTGESPTIKIIKGDSYYGTGNIIELKTQNYKYHFEVLEYQQSFYEGLVIYNISLVNVPLWKIKVTFKCKKITKDSSCVLYWQIESDKIKIIQKVSSRMRLYFQKINEALEIKPTIHLQSISIKADLDRSFNTFINYKNTLSLESNIFTLLSYNKDNGEYNLRIKKENGDDIDFTIKAVEKLKEADKFKITFNLIFNSENIPIQNIVWYVVKIDDETLLYSLSHICMRSIPKEFLRYLSKSKIEFLLKLKNALENARNE